MRANLVTAVLFAVSFVVLTVGVPACGEISTDDERIEARTIEQAACPTPQAVCDNWLPDLGCEASGWCTEDMCIEGARGAETMVSVDNENGELFTRWLVRHEGEMTVESEYILLPCDISFHPRGNFIDIPAGHCAVTLTTEEGRYFEFFAGIPGYCFGWTECSCAEPPRARSAGRRR